LVNVDAESRSLNDFIVVGIDTCRGADRGRGREKGVELSGEVGRGTEKEGRG
jgi:hypothetical protein